MLPWWPFMGLLSLWPIFKSSHCSSFVDQAPVNHYNDVIIGAMASQITSLTIVYSTIYSDTDQRKHQSSASLAFVWVIHRGPVNSSHKWPVTRKMSPLDDVIIWNRPVPDLQMGCSDLTKMRGYQDNSPSNGHQVTCPTGGVECQTVYFPCSMLSHCLVY